MDLTPLSLSYFWNGLRKPSLRVFGWQAAAGRMLYDTTGMDQGGVDRAGVEEGGSAAMLEGTQLCCTCQLRDILHCLGGVSALLPLLAQLGQSNR